jgi:hypothetical protein
MQIGQFARFTQNYAVRVSDFVRKQFCARATDNNDFRSDPSALAE